MIRKTHSHCLVAWGLLVLVILAGNVVHVAELAAATPQVIEVFTSANLSITSESAINQQSDFRESELHVYELDGIQRIEAKLSKGLSSNPDQSKRIVLHRV